MKIFSKIKSNYNLQTFMESITISKRMKEQQKLNLLGNDLMIMILLKHFQISKKDKNSYLKFCDCEKRKSINDFVDYIISKIDDNIFIVKHKDEEYKYYTFQNNLYFSKSGDCSVTFLGEF